MQQNANRNRRPGAFRRRRVPGSRAHQACLHCKDKKLKVFRLWFALVTACLVLDPQSKKSRPRNYLEMLEGRVAGLQSHYHATSPQSTSAAASNDESTSSIPYTPEGRDGTSDLSSRVGMLDFRTTQTEPQYLGSSSSFAFSRIINLSLSSNLPTAPTLAHLSDRRSSPSPCLLPDYDVAVQLSDAYFKHIHPQYPFLHEPTFRTWEAMLYDSSQDFTETGFSFTPLFFLNMVYAVAALLLPNTQSLAGFPSDVDDSAITDTDTVRLSIDDHTYHARIEQLRVDLDTWLTNAPQARLHESDDLSIFAKKAWGQLVEYKESLQKIFEDCIEASRNICQTYRRLYIGTAIRYTWGTLHCLFLAGLTYLHCLWTSPAAWESVRPEDVSKTCTDCTMVLVAIAEGWQAAAPYRDTFEALASRVIAMVFNKSRAVQASLPPPSVTETREPDTWGHWINDMANAGVLEGVDGLLAGFIGDLTTQIN
ncbi:hypothetical protein FOXB_15019 [Fusarium oxysporum f. sp. conglutinans Fo5176]|uniref:Xylanolytic transcriptional activator regulatory domain-containing protein n=1 Tax=Fusarium oxysporum (strain Fo5176) TaxID=660025 RepID=F9G8N7_FUSOF|nr:hypothetical protein FOXB_15019 [Fusarium oxysporum f. sp. conglutinans Fo5176]